MDSPSKNMRFDVCAVEEGQDVLHHVPELRRIQSFLDYPGTPGGELNRDNVIKYIVILYSEDSFLNVKPATALEERKLMAADAAGFERNKKNEFNTDVVEKLFNLRSIHVVQVAVDYLIFQKKHLWTEITTTEQEYEEFIRLRMDPVSSDSDKDTLMAAEKKDKLRTSCKSMRKDLDSLYHEFFTDNTDLKEVHDVTDKATLERRARPA